MQKNLVPHPTTKRLTVLKPRINLRLISIDFPILLFYFFIQNLFFFYLSTCTLQRTNSKMECKKRYVPILFCRINFIHACFYLKLLSLCRKTSSLSHIPYPSIQRLKSFPFRSRSSLIGKIAGWKDTNTPSFWTTLTPTAATMVF